MLLSRKHEIGEKVKVLCNSEAYSIGLLSKDNACKFARQSTLTFMYDIIYSGLGILQAAMSFILESQACVLHLRVSCVICLRWLSVDRLLPVRKLWASSPARTSLHLDLATFIFKLHEFEFSQ